MTRAHKRVRNTFKKQRITWHISCKFVLGFEWQDLYWLSARISMQPRAYKPTSDAARRRAACTQPPSCEFLLFSTTSFSQAAKRTSGRPKILHRPPSPHQPRGARSFFVHFSPFSTKANRTTMGSYRPHLPLLPQPPRRPQQPPTATTRGHTSSG